MSIIIVVEVEKFPATRGKMENSLFMERIAEKSIEKSRKKPTQCKIHSLP